MADDVKLVRNVGVVGQGGVGKTSLADALLFAAGAATRLGRVDDGSSNFDFEPEEIRRKITLTTAFHSLPWKKHELTIVDTPGYTNFLLDTLNCMRACTGAGLRAGAGRQRMRVEAEKVWRRAEELHLPVVAFVSRMDRERADFEAGVADLKQVLGANPVAIQFPIGAAENFRGVVDLISMRALMLQADGSLKEEAIPADVKAEAESARERMVETAAEANDDADREVPRERHAHQRGSAPGAARGHDGAPACAGPVRRGDAKPATPAAAARRHVEYLASAADLGIAGRAGSEDQRADRAASGGERGLLGVRLQDHRRSVRRQALGLPRAVRQGHGRFDRART